MRAFIMALAAVAIAATALTPSEVLAGGLVGLHKKRHVDGKLCMIDHWHNGQSGAWRTKAQAQSIAIRSWKGLVRAEYGNAWADYHASIHKQMKCVALSDGQTSCTVKSRPCRY